ncbi:beta strand repeat-containing protein [Legionella quinlivanii]|uniref:beta strand repeat-containing protein n=1 Tax=Legionella quinlivanii TaxID=45073 RepID=UPI002243525F|nr:DUF4114 domain-containing protein [Legionella quinlivanii]MCW8449691.1 DUF4114 domain-containing protein [Legionella quinlivanii]
MDANNSTRILRVYQTDGVVQIYRSMNELVVNENFIIIENDIIDTSLGSLVIETNDHQLLKLMNGFRFKLTSVLFDAIESNSPQLYQLISLYDLNQMNNMGYNRSNQYYLALLAVAIASSVTSYVAYKTWDDWFPSAEGEDASYGFFNFSFLLELFKTLVSRLELMGDSNDFSTQSVLVSLGDHFQEGALAEYKPRGKSVETPTNTATTSNEQTRESEHSEFIQPQPYNPKTPDVIIYEPHSPGQLSVDGQLAVRSSGSGYSMNLTGRTVNIAPGSTVIVTITDSQGNSVRSVIPVNAVGGYSLNGINLFGLIDGVLHINATVVDELDQVVSASDQLVLDAVQGALKINLITQQNQSAMAIGGTSADILPGRILNAVITDKHGQVVNANVVINPDGSFSLSNINGASLTDGKLTVSISGVDNNGYTVKAVAQAVFDAIAGSISAQVSTITHSPLIDINGLTRDIPAGSIINVIITDSHGNQIHTTATVGSDGRFVLSQFDASSLIDGDMVITVSGVDNNDTGRNANAAAELDALEGSVNTQITTALHSPFVDISGQTVDIYPGNAVTVTLSDSHGNQVSTTAVVNSDGTYQLNQLDVSSLIDGNIVLEVVGIDNNGFTRNANVPVVLDALEGSVDAQISTVLHSPFVDISGQTVDIYPGSVITVTITDSHGNQVSTTAVVSNDGSYQINQLDLSSLIDGNIILEVAGTDNNGFSRNFNIPTELDALASALSTQLVTYNHSPLVDISGQSTDIYPGTVLAVIVSDSHGHQVVTNATVNSDGSFQINQLDVSSLTDGNISVQVTGTDNNGDPLIATQTASLDAIASSLTADLVTTNYSPLIDISGQAIDFASGVVNFTLRDVNGNQISGMTVVDGNGMFHISQLNASGLADGVLTLRVFGQDNNGNALSVQDTSPFNAVDSPPVLSVTNQTIDFFRDAQGLQLTDLQAAQYLLSQKLSGSGGQTITVPQYGVDLSNTIINTPVQVTVNFITEGSANNNMVGYYIYDSNGQIISDKVGFMWLATDTPDGSSLQNIRFGIAQSASYTITEGIQPGQGIGFFVIANGSALAFNANLIQGNYSSLAALNNDVTIENGQVKINGVVVSGDVFFSHDKSLNADAGVSNDAHAIGGISFNNTGNMADYAGLLLIGFEDLFGTGDSDYNDLVFSVNIGSNINQLTTTTASGINTLTDIDSSGITSVEITTSGFLAGDQLQFNGTLPGITIGTNSIIINYQNQNYQIDISQINDGNPYHLLFSGHSGAVPVDVFELLLQAITFVPVASESSAGTRSIHFAVIDDGGAIGHSQINYNVSIEDLGFSGLMAAQDFSSLSAGNEVVHVTDDLSHLGIMSGTSGTDTIQFDQMNMGLSASEIKEHFQSNWEIIDMTGQGNNNLQLDFEAVHQLIQNNQLVFELSTGEDVNVLKIVADGKQSATSMNFDSVSLESNHVTQINDPNLASNEQLFKLTNAQEQSVYVHIVSLTEHLPQVHATEVTG